MAYYVTSAKLERGGKKLSNEESLISAVHCQDPAYCPLHETPSKHAKAFGHVHGHGTLCVRPQIFGQTYLAAGVAKGNALGAVWGGRGLRAEGQAVQEAATRVGEEGRPARKWPPQEGAPIGRRYLHLLPLHSRRLH